MATGAPPKNNMDIGRHRLNKSKISEVLNVNKYSKEYMTGDSQGRICKK
jgi:hypothetical protein